MQSNGAKWILCANSVCIFHIAHVEWIICKIFFKSTLAAVVFVFCTLLRGVEISYSFFFFFFKKLEFQQFTSVKLQQISMCANNLLFKIVLQMLLTYIETPSSSKLQPIILNDSIFLLLILNWGSIGIQWN